MSKRYRGKSFKNLSAMKKQNIVLKKENEL